MKSFFKYVLATVVGLLITGAILFLMGIITLGSMVAASDTTPALKEHSVLHINLSGSIAERTIDNPLSTLLGSEIETTGLEDLLTAIKVAATNDKIDGIYIEGGTVAADPASLEALRGALADFKKSKKFVIAYGDDYSQGAYYVASVADKVLLNPGGMLDWHGYASAPIFYKDLLDKVGVKMQVFRVGTYKSYVEPYTSTEMSEANRQQISSYLHSIWANICKAVSASRKISTDSLNAYADRYIVMADASDYVRMGLVDTLSYVDGLRDQLRKLTGAKSVSLAKPKDVAKLAKKTDADDGEIAVYYAYGSIVGSEIQGLGSEEAIVGPDVVEDLDKLANDDNVKAVVLRINSGGGSAYASEQMWRAIQLLKAKKPVVVSMGGMAASGGYYMSCGADCIYAEPTTLTGSIGIFAMIPDASGLLTEKLGLHFDVVKTNEASDFGVVGRPFNASESAAMQSYVDRGYALFLKRVADGRRMTPQQVDKIAQGRVWTGEQALKIKLVDRLGSLDDAVAEAARRAKAKDYAVTAYPAPASWLDDFISNQGSSYFEQEVRSALGSYYHPLMFVKSLKGTDCIQARIPFEPNLH